MILPPLVLPAYCNYLTVFDPSWTLYDRVDMNGELAWLVAELEAAEANGEAVHILNHIPPGGDAIKLFTAISYYGFS